MSNYSITVSSPYGQKESGKKSLYSIQDPLFRFWFRFVAPNRSLIEKGAKEIVFKRIKPHLSEFMGAALKRFVNNTSGIKC